MKKSKLLTVFVMVSLVAIFVMAAAPTAPTSFTPTNGSILLGLPTLTVSGVTDPDSDAFNITFVQVVTTTQISPAFYNGSCLQEFCNANASQWPDGSGGNAKFALDDSPQGQWLAIGGGAAAPYLCERAEEENYFYSGAGTTATWANAKTACENLNGSNPEGWHLATIDTIEEQGIAQEFCSDAPYCYLAGTSPTGSVGGDWIWDYNRSIENITLQNSSSTSYAWHNLTAGDYNWTAFAYDVNGEEGADFGKARLIKGNFTYDLTGIALNISFVNESTISDNVSSSINLPSLQVFADDTLTYSFSNSTQNSRYSFALEPNGTFTTNTNGTFIYSATDMPQRSYYFNRTLNGSVVLNEILYLLPTADGIFVTFQVVNANSEPVVGALVISEKVIGSQYQQVGGGFTDNSGSITFFLDPDDSHRFTFSREGFNTAIETITPTQSSYTQTLATGTTVNVTSYNQGITIDILPKDSVLTNETAYDFIFNISSTTYNLTSFGFTLTNSTGDVLATRTGTTSAGASLNQTFITTNDTRINMNYYWEVDGNFINATKTWTVKNTYKGQFSLLNFFDDLKTFANLERGGFDDFGLALMAFVIILILVVGAATVVGVSEPIALLGIAWASTFFFEYVGMFPTIGGSEYTITITTGILFLAYIIFENTK